MLRRKDIFNFVLALVCMGATILWGNKPRNEPHTTKDGADKNRDSTNSGYEAALSEHSDGPSWNADDKKNRAEERAHRRYQKGYDTFVGCFSVVAAAAAVAAAMFAREAYIQAKRQAKAAEAQVRVAQDNERRQLRAYVLYSKASLVEKKGEGTFYVDIKIKNSGQTPAYNVTNWWAQKIIDIGADVEDELRFGDTSTDSFDLGSQASHVLRKFADAKPAIITASEVNELIDGKKRLFVWGVIKYRDTFQKCQFTTFRLTNDPLTSPVGPLISAPNGNSASDDPENETNNCGPAPNPKSKQPVPGATWGEPGQR